MPNALDYVILRGDLDYNRYPLNEIDLFLCSQLATPDYKNIIGSDINGKTISEIADEYFSNHTLDVSNLGVLQSTSVLPMLKEMGNSIRFGNAVIYGYDNHVDFQEEEQFSAITIQLTDDLIVVAYRGTDDTIIGWKEDFNLAIYDEVPAQRDALKYLNWAASQFKGNIITVGHSKGGNLSLYASIMSDIKIQDRILKAYSFDGPGFSKEFLETEKYNYVKDKIFTVLSQNAIVGTLLNIAGNVCYVHTTVEGFMAHDGFSWSVNKTEFIREDNLSSMSQSVDDIMDRTLNHLTFDEKKDFIDSLFNALSSTGCVTITDIKSEKLPDMFKVLLSVSLNKNVLFFAENILISLNKYGKSKLRAKYD